MRVQGSVWVEGYRSRDPGPSSSAISVDAEFRRGRRREARGLRDAHEVVGELRRHSASVEDAGKEELATCKTGSGPGGLVPGEDTPTLKSAFGSSTNELSEGDGRGHQVESESRREFGGRNGLGTERPERISSLRRILEKSDLDSPCDPCSPLSVLRALYSSFSISGGSISPDMFRPPPERPIEEQEWERGASVQGSSKVSSFLQRSKRRVASWRRWLGESPKRWSSKREKVFQKAPLQKAPLLVVNVYMLSPLEPWCPPG